MGVPREFAGGERSPATAIDYVRPGPAGLTWLAHTIAELRASDPLRPVAIVVPNYVGGRFIRRELGRRIGIVNVRTLRLVELATAVVAPHLNGRPALTAVLEASAVRAAVDDVGGPLRSMAQHLSLHEALTRLFRDIRRQELGVETALERDPGAMAAAALRTYQEFQRLTAGYVDPTEMRDTATRSLRGVEAAPRALAELGALILFLPTRFDPADARLLAAAARWVPVHAAFAWLDDTDGLGTQLARQGACRLAEALRMPLPPEPTSPAALHIRAETRVVRAPDPAEEVREVLRAIAADLCAGMPLHRIAVLYRQVDPYAPLVREALTLADLPWFGLGGHSLAESGPGRALLAVLRLPERQFAREAVLGWVDAAPKVATGTDLPPSAWDRLSRAANIVRGAHQWEERLEAFAKQQEDNAVRRDHEGAATVACALRRQCAQARAAAGVVASLAVALQSPRDGSPWREFVDWAERVRMRFAGNTGSLPGQEQAESDLVAATLAELARGDEFGRRGATLPLFLATLQAALQGRSLPEGRLGEGVLVGPVQSAMGLAFERVYVLGLTEGAFPPTPATDPFFPRDADDPLDRRTRQRASDRQVFLTALAAADGGRVTLSSPDALAGRAAFPSRWLLEVASVLRPAEAPPLDANAFRALGERENPWLRVVSSAHNGVARASVPADLEDRRLAEAVKWRGIRQKLADHALALRTDLPVRAGLRALAARRGGRFTAYDGNLAGLAHGARRIRRLVDGSGVVSATALERWADCPFRYFLDRVLAAEPTEAPEERWTIDALEKGSLVHEVLEAFFRELAKAARPRDGEPYTAEDVELLEHLAAARFEDARQRGVTGHELIWEVTRKQVLADLRTFLEEDTTWRRTQLLTPTYFEQPFGTKAANAWPVVELPVGEGTLRFRGYIDRVDVSPDGRRAYVFDYKTGKPDKYRGLETDPVLRGQHVQMAVYTRAVRAALDKDIEVGGAYWFVTSKGEFRQVALPADPALVEGRLDAALTAVSEGIQQGVFPAVPGEESRGGFSKCDYCPYDRVCTTTRDQEWERKQHDGCAPFLALANGLAEIEENGA